MALRGARAARGRRRPLRHGDVRGRGGCRPRVARRPLVAKLVSDPAYERAQRYGLFARLARGVPDASAPAAAGAEGARTRALRRAHGRSSSRALTSPRSRPAGASTRRGSRAHEPGAAAASRSSREQLEPGTFVFVGRLTRQKALGRRDRRGRPRARGAPRRRRRRPRSRARSSGRAADSGAADRITFRGALPRDEALRIVAGADAALLSSDWENLPHSAVEALSVGVPVVSTAVGGVPEVVRDGENGLLVPPRARGRARGCDRPDRSTSRACGNGSPRPRSPRSPRLSSEAIYGRLEALLAEAAQMSAKPRVLFVGRMPLPPAAPGVAREEVGRGRAGARLPRPRRGGGGQRAERRPLPADARRSRPQLLDGILFYMRLPLPGHARRSATSDPDAIVAADPVRRRGGARSGARSPRRRSPVIVEVHGDWRTFTRALRLAVAAAARARRRRARAPARVRHADATRAVSTFTSRLIEDVRGSSPQTPSFPTYSDLSAFTERPLAPLPERPTAVFVGTLEAVQEHRRARRRLAARRASSCPRRGS